MASFALEVTRFGFSFAGFVSPDLAGRLAFSLFCRTPPRRPKDGKAVSALASGAEQLTGAERIMLPVSSGNIAARRLGAENADAPRVLIVHGWGSRAEYLATLATGLHRGGAEVVLLDLPGHGHSSGRLLNLRLAAEAICAVQERLGFFDVAIGHSFGGAAVMTAIGGVFPGACRFEPGRVVLLAAPSNIHWVIDGFCGMLKLRPAVRQAMVKRAEAVAGCPVDALDTVPIAARIGRDILVLHAEEDKEVRAEHARRLEGAGNHVTVRWANGLGHRRIVAAPEIIAEVASFVFDDNEGIADEPEWRLSSSR
ncbi:alpha/beta fold hydrolase [Ciceribacter sp. RN22]|uniref:alpha/beta fold hydrolase n=1 Tax=Ciceribacter sp. RN22 TaxID=2954932 RepID=UPI0020934E55|nr:alpha/beta fold hydrolase [Ciceribacter sp. RN22]MCO6178615.1 alpha/beta hydrolase [Ciceribacter sp. RN22]